MATGKPRKASSETKINDLKEFAEGVREENSSPRTYHMRESLLFGLEELQLKLKRKSRGKKTSFQDLVNDAVEKYLVEHGIDLDQ